MVLLYFISLKERLLPLRTQTYYTVMNAQQTTAIPISISREETRTRVGVFGVAVDDDELERRGDFGLEPLAEPGHVLRVVLHLLLSHPAGLTQANNQWGRNSAGSDAAFLQNILMAF